MNITQRQDRTIDIVRRSRGERPELLAAEIGGADYTGGLVTGPGEYVPCSLRSTSPRDGILWCMAI